MEEQINAELEKAIRSCGAYLYFELHKNSQQSRVLDLLRRKGQTTQKEIQSELHIQAGSVSELITKLENRHLLKRTKDEKDRRRVLLEITERGIAFLEDHKQEPDGGLFACLCDEDKILVTEKLNILLKNWKRN